MAAGCLDRWKKEGADEAVAAVMALVDAVRSSKADSMAGLQAEVKAAAEELKCLDSEPYGALSAACGMFVQYLRRGGGGADDQPAPSSAVKRRVVGRATRFGDICRGARGTIATLCQDFLLDGCTVLVHGHSAPVLDALRLAGTSGKRLLVLCTEGRPDGAGLRLAGELAAAGVSARVLLDSAVAYSMAQVDVVLLGADLVAETGGVVGAVGTYQVALVAHAMGKPVYVAAESNKFAKLYPLGQKDIEQGVARAVDFGDVRVPAGVDVEAPARDYMSGQKWNHPPMVITGDKKGERKRQYTDFAGARTPCSPNGNPYIPVSSNSTPRVTMSNTRVLYPRTRWTRSPRSCLLAPTTQHAVAASFARSRNVRDAPNTPDRCAHPWT
ncbi:translation initiation factor eIF-2B subunit alpha [Hordeum vulgare]|nr:translation initiation factor eIF-2B subunit alpha [Hordeum vulgare]